MEATCQIHRPHTEVGKDAVEEDVYTVVHCCTLLYTVVHCCTLLYTVVHATVVGTMVVNAWKVITTNAQYNNCAD